MTRFRRFALSILILAGTVWLVSAPALAQSADATKRLFDAVRANEKAKVQAAIAEGADVNVRNSLGMTPIDIAVDRGFYDLAHFLLSHRGAIAKGDATPSAPGPLAAEPVPVPSVQKTEILGAPGKPSQYVTVPSAPPQAVERPAPEPVQAPPPPPKLAPGQPNPFAPGKAVVATRAAQAPPAAPTGPAPASTGSASEGGLFDKIKGVFTASPENVAKPVEDKPATEKTEVPAAKEPEGRPAEPDSGPGIMDRLKGIFGSSPDKSSAAPPPAPEAMAAVAPVAPPTPAPIPAIA
ncbi:MAG: ankyrin repeat domain-containing protein, partial [Magnetospirillum sp. WYHS-4]